MFEAIVRHVIGEIKGTHYIQVCLPFVFRLYHPDVTSLFQQIEYQMVCRRFLTGIQDYYNRKGLLSDRGEKKQAYYVLRDYYRSLAAQKQPPGPPPPSLRSVAP